MARARDIAARLEELSKQRQDQELRDLHQALTWTFENSQSQYSKINCFCDQPTLHMDKLPESHQLTLQTYDTIEHQGQHEDKNVHTVLFKPSHRTVSNLVRRNIQGKLTAIVSLKCTQQPEHIAEAVYLHQRKNIKSIMAVHYIGEAAVRSHDLDKPGRYQEHRLFAVIHTSDKVFDTTFTINYPTPKKVPNMPFMIMAGCKDTLRGQGLDTPEIQRLPDALAVRPSFRPDLNLTKENTSSYCIAINPQQHRAGWYTAGPLAHCLQMHRELTETEEQVEMQLKPAYIWHNEQQQPCKYAMVQLQASDAEQDKQTRKVLNAAGLKYTINRQTITIHGNLDRLEDVRLQLLQKGIKLPMTPQEGAVQLTIHQVTAADTQQGLQGVQFYCKVGTIEYLSTVRLQIAEEHPLLCAHDIEDLNKQLQEQIGDRIDDLTLEQVSPDAGRSTQLVHTFLVHKDSHYLRTPPYNCKINIPTLGSVHLQLQHCGMRIGRTAPRKTFNRIQDTMADVHDTLIGQHQALPSHGTRGQKLGVTDTGAHESITRMQRVVIVDTYSTTTKTRALIVQEPISIVAIDANITTEEALDIYETANLPKWHSRPKSKTQLPHITRHNTTLSTYSVQHAKEYPADKTNCLLHLRIRGVQPYMLNKLNHDTNTGKCGNTPNETIELLPYQDFDIIVPLPTRALIPYISQDPSRVQVVASVSYKQTLTNRQCNPPSHNERSKQHQSPSKDQPEYPSPPRTDTTRHEADGQTTNLPPFPILQTRSTKPQQPDINYTRRQPENQAPASGESPTLPWTIKEYKETTAEECGTPIHTKNKPPDTNGTKPHEGKASEHTEVTLQVSSDEEERMECDKSDDGGGDVEMTPIETETIEREEIKPEPKGGAPTQTEEAQRPTEEQHGGEPAERTKDSQRQAANGNDHCRNTNPVPGTTGQAILQAARPLQKLLRHIPEHQTTGNKDPQGPPSTPDKGREINPADSIDKDTIYTYTPDGEQHSQSRHQQEDQAKAAIAADNSNKPRKTQQQLHALYIAACDELGIPEKATNSDMQRVACQVYQDIWSYADHLLAMLRVLTLAKTPRSKATKKTEPPIIQLRRLVARGWTLDQRQHNTAQEGMSQMGLAICLTTLLTDKQIQEDRIDLTSHYVDYAYRLTALQQQYQPPLFTSLRRHCGHNLHATILIDPILTNTANNSQHNLQQGDLHALLQPAKLEYEKRHQHNQCDTCYKPGTIRQDWKAFPGQLAILYLNPASGEAYLPTMRSKDQDSEHIILHQLRARKATLWNKEYSVTAALVGVASNPKELAETALLELPTRNQPNQYHIYHGTQYSRAIEEGQIPSWWVVLALVLQETTTIPQNVPPPRHSKQQTRSQKHDQRWKGADGTIARTADNKQRVRKTIQKRKAGCRQQNSQQATAHQRKAALANLLRATARGPPHNQTKKPRTTYQRHSESKPSRQIMLTLTPQNAARFPQITDLTQETGADQQAEQAQALHNVAQAHQPAYDHPHHNAPLPSDEKPANHTQAPPLEQDKPSGHTEQDQLPVSPDITEAQQGDEDGDITMLDAQHNTTAQRDKQHSTTQQINNSKVQTERTAAPTNKEEQQYHQRDQPESETPIQPLHRYGLISLFDGCASVHDLITEAAGVPPTVFIAAENDPDIRQYVGAKNKWNTDGEWFRKGTSYYRYLTDVDQLVDNGGAVLKQALETAPDIPYIVIAGSPCQDLTTIGKHKGVLGLAGTRSIHFYTFHLTVHYLQQALSPHKVIYVLENAASMKAEYRQAIQLILGNSGRKPQLRERDSGEHTVAQRRRYFFTNSRHTSEPTADGIPWDPPWTSIEQLTHNPKHRLLPIVRLQGRDQGRGLYKHSHIALHPYSLLYHSDTLPSKYLTDNAESNQLLQPAFWRRHLPKEIAEKYCSYLALELKTTRTKHEDSQLDQHTEELSHLFQNPCMQLPVRPLHHEEALRATGIAQYVPSRQDLTPYRTPQLCQSLAGNSFHPKLILATLGGEANIRNHIRASQHEPSTDNSRVHQPKQAQEHFATRILAPLIENRATKQPLMQARKANEEQIRALNPYRHLELTIRQRATTAPQQSTTHGAGPGKHQLGPPDDQVALYRQAQQRCAAEEAHANHQLVPAILSPGVHDRLVTTNCYDLLIALRATRYQSVSKASLIKQLVGSDIQPVLEGIPGIQAADQPTSLVSALQWWAAQAHDAVAVSPARTVILVHLPTASTPTLLHIGSKQPRTAYYVQHLPEPTHVLVGHIASHSTAQQISKRETQQPELAEQLGLAYLPSPTLRIKESDTVTVSLAVHGGNITRQAAAWEQTLTMHAPTQCIACHYLAHITGTTLTPNYGRCQGTAIQALVQGAIHITATYTSEDHEGTAEAAVITAHWPHQAHQQLMPDQLPAEIPFVMLARKAHQHGGGPKLHPKIAELIPLQAAPASTGPPALPTTQTTHTCTALTPAALHQSDALILGKAPKHLLGDVLWHAAPVTHDIPM